MARSDARDLGRPEIGRRRWRVPYVIRLTLAALLAAGVAFAISYALRRLNY
jgi:hypothetical protein